MSDDLRSAYDQPELAELWRLARETMESPRPRSAFSIQVPDLETATALGTVLRKHLDHPGRRQISVVKLDEHLRASRFGRGLVEILELVHGKPVQGRDSAAELTWERRDPTETTLWKSLREYGLDERPWAAEWVGQVRRHGRIPQADLPVVARRAAEVLSRMVLDGRPREWTSRQELAGNDLDSGLPLARIVLRGAALAIDVDLPQSRARQEQLWERCGVAPDSLSDPLLCWGLPNVGRHLTLADRLDIPAGIGVAVCVSARVVEAVSRAGVEHPLVCLESQLTITARHWLGLLADAGARLRVHSDFTPGGLRLANEVLALGGTPWRMSADDYRGAVAALVEQGVELSTLNTAPEQASWDPLLAGTMTTAGLQVEEEQVLPDLVADLADGTLQR